MLTIPPTDHTLIFGGFPIKESRFIPQDMACIIDAEHGGPLAIVGWGRSTYSAKRLDDRLRFPVLEMSDEEWAAYRADRRWLTPGEWQATIRAEVAERITEDLRAKADALFAGMLR